VARNTRIQIAMGSKDSGETSSMVPRGFDQNQERVRRDGYQRVGQRARFTSAHMSAVSIWPTSIQSQLIVFIRTLLVLIKASRVSRCTRQSLPQGRRERTHRVIQEVLIYHITIRLYSCRFIKKNNNCIQTIFTDLLRK